MPKFRVLNLNINYSLQKPSQRYTIWNQNSGKFETFPHPVPIKFVKRRPKGLLPGYIWWPDNCCCGKFRVSFNIGGWWDLLFNMASSNIYRQINPRNEFGVLYSLNFTLSPHSNTSEDIRERSLCRKIRTFARVLQVSVKIEIGLKPSMNGSNLFL